MSRRNPPDWQAIRLAYEQGEDSFRSLGRRFGVHHTSIGNHAREEGWERASEREGQMEISGAAGNPDQRFLQEEGRRRSRLEEVTEQLLERISQSIGELDQVVLREVEKVRDVAYENPERPDKPTRESTREVERLSTVRSCIDRNGVKLLASALKELKDAQMLRTPGDLREQEAKIANLLRQAREEKDSGDVTVELSPEVAGLGE